MKRQNVVSLVVICVVLVGMGVALLKAPKPVDDPQKIGERGVRLTSRMTANDVMGYKTKTFTVSDKNDPLWQSTITAALTAVPGTKGFSGFDPAKGTVTVVYDPALTSEEKLAVAIDATKFRVQP